MRRFRKIREIDTDILKRNSQYIAGLMDGEGAFMIKFSAGKKRPYFRPLLALAMNHKETIKFVKDKFGVTYAPISRKLKSHVGGEEKVIVKTTYRTLVLVEDDIKKVLTTLLPSLITKKRHAELILKFIRMKQDFSGTKEALRDLLLKQAEIYTEVKRLQTKGPPFDENKFRKRFDEAIHKI